MAIVKNNYIKQGRGEKQKAKATVRYIEHRTGRKGARVNRTLFGWEGAMDRRDAYRLIESAETGSVFYRFVLSPDPTQEDTQHDLSLREVTEKTMSALEEHIQQHISWVAAVHADHTPIRHVHIVAVVPGRLTPQEFRSLPQVLREAATKESAAQRRQLDQGLAITAQEREQEEEVWERSV